MNFNLMTLILALKLETGPMSDISCISLPLSAIKQMGRGGIMGESVEVKLRMAFRNRHINDKGITENIKTLILSDGVIEFPYDEIANEIKGKYGT